MVGRPKGSYKYDQMKSESHMIRVTPKAKLWLKNGGSNPITDQIEMFSRNRFVLELRLSHKKWASSYILGSFESLKEAQTIGKILIPAFAIITDIQNNERYTFVGKQWIKTSFDRWEP